MSLSAEPVETFVVDDPRIDFDREARFLVERSGGDVNYRTWKQISASASSISFNTTVPSRDTAISSKIYVRIPITVTVTGDDLGAPIKDFLALRFAPFTSCCNSIQLELNGKIVSSNVYRYYPALMKYCNSQTEMTNDYSCMPTYMDTYESYNNPTASNARRGANRDAVAGYDEGSLYEPTRRAGYLQNITTTAVGDPDTNTAYRFSFVVEELIPLSPLFWGHREVKSLIGLDTLNLSFQIRDLSRMFCSWRFGPGQVGTGDLSFNFNQDALQGALIEFIYIKPRANVVIPRTIRYPYNNLLDFSVAGEALAQGESAVSQQFSNIQLSGIPKRLYIFVKRKESDENYHTTDTYARIDKITLDLGTRSGLLGECTPQVLYRMAVKNGYQGSWDAWYKHIGSVLCIDFASDISLDLLDAPGMLKQMQLSFKLDYTSLYSNAATSYIPVGGPIPAQVPVNYNIYLIVVYDGMLIIQDGQILYETNDVSALDLVESGKVRKVSYDDIADYVYGGMYTGGSLSKFIGKVKTGYNKAKDFAQQKILPGVQKALPYIEKGVKVAAEVLPALAALGYSEEEIFDIVNGKGGKVMPKKSIKARAARR